MADYWAPFPSRAENKVVALLCAFAVDVAMSLVADGAAVESAAADVTVDVVVG